MKNKTIRAALLFGVVGAFAITNYKANTYNPVYADPEPTEVSYADVYMNDLTLLTYDGNVQHTASNNMVAYLEAGCSCWYSGPKNVSIKFRYVCWWTSGLTYIYIRCNDQFSGTGYVIGWENNGHVFLAIKDGAILQEYPAGTFPYWFNAAEDQAKYDVKYEAIDLTDGSTRIRFYINETMVINHTIQDAFDGNQFGFYSDSAYFGLIGAENLGYNTFSLEDAATPITSANYPWAGYENGVATLSGGVAGFSGATYVAQVAGDYGFRAKVKPTQLAGQIYFNIFAKNGIHECNRPNITGDWGWSDVGYYIIWDRWGLFSALRGETSIGYNGVGIPFDNFPEVTIEIGIRHFGDGSNRITLRVNDIVYLNCFDLKTDSNTPPELNSNGGTPGSLLAYNSVWSYWSSCTVRSADDVAPTEKTIALKDLGSSPAISGDQTIDRNGNVTSLKNGYISYTNKLNNTAYSFKARFDTIGSTLDLLLNYDGTPGNAWSDSWTTKGYGLLLYPNGQLILMKAGTMVCEGWAIGGFSFATNTDYTIKVGSVALSSGVERVFCYINDVLVLNYVDTNNPITTAGKFTICSNSFNGSLSLIGVTYPTMNEIGEVSIDIPVELSYQNPQVGDEVSYHIDTDLSTAAGVIVGNMLTVTAAGVLYVYCVVNGIASDVVSCESATLGVVFDQIVSTYEFGSSSPLQVHAKFSDDRVATSTTYSIAEGNDIASIDENGNITVTGIGVIRVEATLEDNNSNIRTSSDSVGFIVVKPTNIIFTTELLKIKDVKELEANINAPIPEGDDFSFAITEGNELASISGNVITAQKIGNIKIEVTFAAGKPYSISKEFTVVIKGARIDSVPQAPLLVGDEDGVVTASLSDGAEATSIKYYVENGTGKASIDENTGVIHYIAAGTVFVYAIVDGIETEKATLVINPKVEVGNQIGMAVGAERYLGYHANCELPDEDITTTYELLFGQENVAEFDPNTGHIKATKIGTFTVRVTVVGETFYAISQAATIAIENPMVVVTSVVRDMYIGNTQTMVVVKSPLTINLSSFFLEMI